MCKEKRPDWVPSDADEKFTTHVIKGIDFPSNHNPRLNLSPITKPHEVPLALLVEGVKKNDRVVLGRAITLIESNAQKHKDKAQNLLKELLADTGNSLRIGITGVPGAGKSTFIEALGLKLCERGHRLAVLAVDPSSTLSKGSVLGDKTRMEKLSRQENCFIRPSASGGTLGGVARKTRETMLLLEAAGYDIIFIETVGVGQNEVTVRSMVDFFLLLKIAGAGDELQGIKKGVVELADAVLINKADGDNLLPARLAEEEFKRALSYLKSPTRGWKPKAMTCSALNNQGIEEIWELIWKFKAQTEQNGVFAERRQKQMLTWLHDLLTEYALNVFYNNSKVKEFLPEIEKAVLKGELPSTFAAGKLIEIFENTPL